VRRISGFWTLSILLLVVCRPGAQGPARAAAPVVAPRSAGFALLASPSDPAAKLDCANPTGELRGDKLHGGQLYATMCASCHGAQGHGDGPASKGLKPPPANHTDPVRMGNLTDAHIYKVICAGGASVGKSPIMAAWGPVVGDQGIRDLIAHIRSLSGT